MATDITNHDPTVSPSHDNDENGTGALGVDATRGTKRARPNPEDDDDDDEKGGKERRKIDIKFIQDKSRRHITFSKRKAGIMKKVSSGARDEDPPIRVRVSMAKNTYSIPGLRTFSPYRNSSFTACRLRNWSSLYLHHTKITTFGHKIGRKEFDSGAPCHIIWLIISDLTIRPA
jgi:hypothetical protein